MTTATPIYFRVVSETGTVPEQIYARCSSLTAFTFGTPSAAKRHVATAPKVGQKPIRKRKK
jgi:hypothetical protein